VVLLTADPTRRPGRATVRLAFDESTDRVAMPDGDVRPGPWAQSGTTTARAYLRLVRPAGAPMRLRAGRPFRIGRLADCELAIEQPSVSRYHALVYERNGGWYVRDEGSTNGTFVNLAPVRGPVRLRNADELRLGATVTLRFELLPPPHVRAVAPS
jgi:hypothetical protein